MYTTVTHIAVKPSRMKLYARYVSDSVTRKTGCVMIRAQLIPDMMLLCDTRTVDTLDGVLGLGLWWGSGSCSFLCEIESTAGYSLPKVTSLPTATGLFLRRMFLSFFPLPPLYLSSFHPSVFSNFFLFQFLWFLYILA